eukprot:5763173-Heterocapsa_arctica.AAC.1
MLVSGGLRRLGLASYKRVLAPTTYKVSLCTQELREQVLDMRKQIAKNNDRPCSHCDGNAHAQQQLRGHIPCLASILSRWRSIAQLQILIRKLVRSNRADFRSWQMEQLHDCQQAEANKDYSSMWRLARRLAGNRI